MSLAEHLSKIREAGTDPQAVALVTLEILLEGREPELRRAVECAAIPHWFDERIFTALLDPDLQPASADWFKAVVALSAVEPFPARSGYNVHEATRLALRKRLATQHPDRFAELSRRAVTAFDGAAAAFRIERVFDRLIVASDDAVRELRGLEYDLRANPEDALSLARMLSEYAADRSWNPFVRGWSLLLQAILRREYLALHEALSYAEEARECFADGVSALGEALAYRELGEQFVLRRQPGDVERAFTCFERSLAFVERLQAERPEDSRASRDVAVALDRMAQFHHELRGNSELALRLFERSHAIWERLLAASPADERAMRDVSVSLNKIGDVYFELAQGPDYDRALAAYERSLEIDEGNFARNPQNVQAARDVGMTATRLGDVYARRGFAGERHDAHSTIPASDHPPHADVCDGVRCLIPARFGPSVLRDQSCEAFVIFASDRSGCYVELRMLSERFTACGAHLRDGHRLRVFAEQFHRYRSSSTVA